VYRGNLFNHVIIKKMNLPSTRDVSKVTLAAFRLPAGNVMPILSNFSRNIRPPFLDFAL
jgi:hypothetical protein